MNQDEPKSAATQSASEHEEQKSAQGALIDHKEASLERKRLALEYHFKRAELVLKKRELHILRSPAVLTIIALTGTAFAAIYQARQSLALERTKAQSNLILEAIKTGNRETATSNLEFLIDVGLLDDANGRIRDRLSKRDGPVLPSSVLDVGQNSILVSDSKTLLPLKGVRIHIHNTHKDCPPTNNAGETNCKLLPGERLDLNKTGYKEKLDEPPGQVIWLDPVGTTRVP